MNLERILKHHKYILPSCLAAGGGAFITPFVHVVIIAVGGQTCKCGKFVTYDLAYTCSTTSTSGWTHLLPSATFLIILVAAETASSCFL